MRLALARSAAAVVALAALPTAARAQPVDVSGVADAPTTPAPTPESSARPAAPPAPPGFLPTGLVPPSAVIGAPPPRPPTSVGSSWEFGLSLRGSIEVASGDTDASNTYAEQVHAVLTRFLVPVVDDDAPYSLQPFLQRAGALTLDVSQSVAATPYRFFGQHGVSADVGVGAAIGLDAYLTRWLPLTLGFAYAYDTGAGEFLFKTHAFDATGGLGVRIADVRVDLVYDFDVSHTGRSFDDVHWGTLTLDATAVFARRGEIAWSGSVFDGGASTSVTYTHFVRKHVGVFGGGFVALGEHFTDGTPFDEYGGRAGAIWWITPRTRLVFDDQLGGFRIRPEFTFDGRGESFVANAVRANIVFRP